jgi:xanthine/uracil permease
MWSLPIFCWVLCAFFLLRRGAEWRAAFVVSSVVWGCLVTAFTEILGLFQMLTTTGLAVCWAGTILLVLALNWRLQKPWRIEWKYPLSRTETAMVCAMALIGVATLVTAIVAPPNNADSMAYHMARVVHWLQNRSVAHYPTHIIRQLELNPWAEFAITHFQALSGGDRLANLVQWFSMVGSTVAASLVAGELGGGRRAQFLTGVVVVTIPMGILQASSTQNDYVVGFWLLCFLWSGMRFKEEPVPRWALMTGASLGLAILTKGTAYLYAFPFVLWLGYAVVKSVPARRLYPLVLGIVLAALVLNSGHYARNWALFSNPLLSGTNTRYSNEIFSVKVTLSNIVRNLSLQVVTPFEGVNRRVEKGVREFHALIGMDVNDPQTTFGGMTYSIPRLEMRDLMHEDHSGNLLHALLAAITLVLLFCSKSLRRRSSNLTPYVFGIVAGFLLFCIILKWQPWASRLHLPLFLLGAPAVGVMLEWLGNQWLSFGIAAILVVAALPWTFGNVSRPLAPSPTAIVAHFLHGTPLPPTIFSFGRTLQYFTNAADLYPYFLNTALTIKTAGARNVGLILGTDDWEYPLWVLLKDVNGKVPRMEHIMVTNPSGEIPLPNFKPDLIVKFENRYPHVVFVKHRN